MCKKLWSKRISTRYQSFCLVSLADRNWFLNNHFDKRQAFEKKMKFGQWNKLKLWDKICFYILSLRAKGKNKQCILFLFFRNLAEWIKCYWYIGKGLSFAFFREVFMFELEKIFGEKKCWITYLCRNSLHSLLLLRHRLSSVTKKNNYMEPLVFFETDSNSGKFGRFHLFWDCTNERTGTCSKITKLKSRRIKSQRMWTKWILMELVFWF